MAGLPIAIQVYSLREEAEKDFAGVMGKIRQMGYDGVELAGLYGMKPEEVRAILDKNGLTAISAHVSFEELMENMDKAVENYRSIGCSYIVIPSLSRDRLYGGALYQETLEDLRTIADVCRNRGITLMYHNHEYEFEKTENGSCILDELYQDTTAEELEAEFDTCWVDVGGADPVSYLNRFTGRCSVVHMKDYTGSREVPELTALGTGKVDVAAIAAAAEKNGAKWFVIEQDDHPFGNPMDNMREGLEYLRQL